MECFHTRSKKFWISFMSVSLFVSLLPYWNYVNMGIYPVLDEISFWIFLETFLGYFWTVSKLFWISCMSVTLSVGLLPQWNYYRDISSSGWDIILIFLETFSRYLWTISKLIWISCRSVTQSLISSNWLFLGVNFWDLWSCFSGG